MVNPPFVRSPYNYDPVAACDECSHQQYEPSLTQQNQAEDADINTIVRRFGLTGQLPDNYRTPLDGDFENIFDYKSAMDAVAAANSHFNKMPAGLRAQFDNDPAIFHDYCTDPDNLPTLRKLGLAKPEEAPQEEDATTRPPGAQPAPGAPQGSPGVPEKAEQNVQPTR